jgi:hypothetical protein
MTDITTSNSLTDLAVRIRAEHEAARLAARTTIEHAIRAGELLIEAKQLVQHGYWGDWLHAHCDLSERSAQAYMRIARYQSNPQLTADLTIDDALKVLAKPKPGVIDAADELIRADWLPDNGQVRIGILDLPDRNIFEMFGVVEDERHPGYFRIAHTEDYGDDGGGCFTEPKSGRPVRGDWVRTFFEHFTRHPDLFDRIEWEDRPAHCWPFPRIGPRWPKWEAAP